MYDFRMRRDWLKDRIKEVGGTQEECAEAIGTSRKRINDLVTGKAADFSTGELVPLATYLKWDLLTLLRYVGVPVVEDPKVEIIAIAEAGAWRPDATLPVEERYSAPVGALASAPQAGQIGIEVRGPGADTQYPDGTLLICVPITSPTETLEVGRRYIVQRRSERGFEITVKERRLDGDGNAWFWPMSRDPKHQTPWPADDPDVEATAIVMASLRPE